MRRGDSFICLDLMDQSNVCIRVESIVCVLPKRAGYTYDHNNWCEIRLSNGHQFHVDKEYDSMVKELMG